MHLTSLLFRIKDVDLDLFPDSALRPITPGLGDYETAEKLGAGGFDCGKLDGKCPLSSQQIKLALYQFEKKEKEHD